MRDDVRLEWITPGAERMLVHLARVSNPASQEAGEGADRLIRYLIRNNHWSPFEMVHACFEINTTRDIGRQILRHRSFSFQEFSQRYADPTEHLVEWRARDCRLQDPVNRQNSVDNEDGILAENWYGQMQTVVNASVNAYKWALSKGIAKEVARALLPEGLMPTRMYMVGSFRSWVHYLAVRTDKSTQREHRRLADMIYVNLVDHAPSVFIHGVHEVKSAAKIS